MKTKAVIKREIRAAELAWKSVFSVEKDFNSHLRKWQDDTLYDMYDHNQFVPIWDMAIDDECVCELTAKDFEEASAYQRAKNLNYLKLESRKPLEGHMFDSLKQTLGLDGGETYTMYLPKKPEEGWKRNEYVEIRDAKHVDISEPLKEIEMVNYGENYGPDFVIRKMNRYIQKAKEDENFHYYGAFLEGKIAGACYAYVKGGYIMLDGLIVNKDVRKQYVATTLMDSISKQFDGIMFLHADPEDTPKDMYAKMGFEVIDTVYEYSAKL